MNMNPNIFHGISWSETTTGRGVSCLGCICICHGTEGICTDPWMVDFYGKLGLASPMDPSKRINKNHTLKLFFCFPILCARQTRETKRLDPVWRATIGRSICSFVTQKNSCWQGTWHFRALPREEQSVAHVYSPEVASGYCLYRGHDITDQNNVLLLLSLSLLNQGKSLKATIYLHCLIPPKIGNLMTPVVSKHQQPNNYRTMDFAARWPSRTWLASHRDIDTNLSYLEDHPS